MSIPLMLMLSMAIQSLPSQVTSGWLKPPTPNTSLVQRTQSETQFIAAEFGVHLAHKRLSRRELLALKFTQLQEDEDQPL